MKQTRVVLTIVALACAACGGNDITMTTTTTTTVPVAAPTVSSINPTSGSTSGGTAVTVTGSNFSSGASLILGGIDATNESVSGGTTLTATTGARGAGRVEVTVRNSDGQSGTLPNAFEYVVVPTLRAVPGGPYSADAERNITMSGVGSTSSPFPIAHYYWNCGQTPKHGKACDQDTPTPTFEYIKTGKIGSPNVVYTVTLRIEDTNGNSATATTTVSVRQVY